MLMGLFISFVLVFIAASVLMLVLAPIAIIIESVLWVKGWVKW